MPKVEKEIHKKAFTLFMEMGGIANKAFLTAFEKTFGKTARTFWNWYRDFGWSERAAYRVESAVENLEQAGILNAEELISGFLDVCRHRMSEVGERSEYLKAIFATAYDRIPSPANPKPENPLVVNSIGDMERLVKSQERLVKEEQAWIRMCLTLVGEPERIMEDRMIVEFVGLDENVFTDAEQSVADNSSEIREKDNASEDQT